jgi:hypothetical protein
MKLFTVTLLAAVSTTALIMYIKDKIIERKLKETEYFINSERNDINFLHSKVKKTG